jgi:hypothetical protein
MVTAFPSRDPSTLNHIWHLCFCVIVCVYLINAAVVNGLTALFIWKCSNILFQTVHLQLRFRWFHVDSVTSTNGIFIAIIIYFSYVCVIWLFSVEEYIESDLETRCWGKCLELRKKEKDNGKTAERAFGGGGGGCFLPGRRSIEGGQVKTACNTQKRWKWTKIFTGERDSKRHRET